MPVDRNKKGGGFMESNLTGWSDHKFLSGQVMVGSHAPGLWLLWWEVLSNLCPLFLSI